jgi:MFS family permease
MSRQARISSEPLWSRAFVFHFFSSFLLAMSLTAVMTVMPLYVARVLHGNNSLVGMATAMFTVSAVLVRPFMGHLLDTMDRRRLFLVALLALALSHLSNLLISGFAVLFVLRFLHGVPWGAAQTASSTIAADLVPAERRGEGLGYFGLTFTFAGAIGPFASLSLLDTRGFPDVFVTATILGIISFALAALGRLPAMPVHHTPLRLRSILEYRVASIAIATLMTTTSWGIVLSFIALYAQEQHLPHPGLYFTLDAAGTFLSRFRAGHLFDRYGPRWLLFGGFCALILSILLLGIAPNPAAYAVSALLLGVSFGIIVPVTLAMTMNLVEPARRGKATATLFSSFDSGVGLGAVLFGLIAQHAGFRIMWIMEAAFLVLPAIMFFVYIVPRYEANVQPSTIADSD